MSTIRWSYDRSERLVGSAFCEADGAWRTEQVPAYTARGEKIEEIPAELAGKGIYSHHIEGTDLGFSAQGARRIKTVYDGEGKPTRVRFQRADGSTAMHVLLDYV